MAVRLQSLPSKVAQRSNFLDLADLILFHPDKELTRIEFFKRSVLIVTAIIAAGFLYSIGIGHRNISRMTLIAFDAVACIAALSWILTSRIVTGMQLDVRNKNFVVYFMTALKEKNVLMVPFETLTSRFEKTPTRYQPKRWTLKVYNKKKKRLQINTNENGFSQETLEDLAKQLSKIRKYNMAMRLTAPGHS